MRIQKISPVEPIGRLGQERRGGRSSEEELRKSGRSFEEVFRKAKLSQNKQHEQDER